MILDGVFYALLKPVFDERRVQIAFDALVQVFVYLPGLAFGARLNHRNLVRYDLGSG